MEGRVVKGERRGVEGKGDGSVGDRIKATMRELRRECAQHAVCVFNVIENKTCNQDSELTVWRAGEPHTDTTGG